MKPKILLHACCGPCSTHCFEELSKDHDVIAYYFNPNIYPKEEFLRRQKEFIKYCEAKGYYYLLDDHDTSSKKWAEFVKGLETKPERGKRCLKCFELRMIKTAERAKELGIKTFTTTLSISPFKDFSQICEAGKKAEEKTGIIFLDMNFKKDDGFKKSIEIGKKHHMKRQNYCGCKYSIKK